MPRTTIGGDDPDHDLPPDEKDKLEQELRAQARQHLKAARAKESRKLVNKAVNISRKPSRRSQHH